MGALSGKVVVITGAASGIGRATAQLFAAEGARLVLADKAQEVEDAAAEIRSGGGSALARRMDAGVEAEVAALVESAVETFGGVDVVFANAGIAGGLKSIFEQDEDDWSQILRVNLIAPFLAIKHGAPRIAERGGGAIVCTASIAGLRSGAGGPAYSASKAGVINLVQVAAQQLATSHVRVNALCPGLIETGMTDMIFNAARDAGKESALGRLNPLRRPGTVEEMARAALFLATDASSYVNGQALVADGGLSTSHPVPRQEYGRTAA